MTLYYDTKDSSNDSTKIAYNKKPASSEAQDKPGVIFLSGFRSDKEGSKALYLEEHCTKTGQEFIRFDYFAHGLSSGDFKNGTISRWKNDVLTVLDHLTDKNRSYILVGSSMGGWLMLLATLERPERIKALIGIAAAPDFTEDLMFHAMSDAQKAQLEAQGFIEEPNNYSDMPYIITKALIEDGRNNLLLKGKIAIDKPVIILHGKQDKDVPAIWAEKIENALPAGHTEIIYIEDGDHRLSREQDLPLLGKAVDKLTHA